MSPLNEPSKVSTTPCVAKEPNPNSNHGYWRGLEQLVGSELSEQELSSEFPMLAEAIASHDRRSFLRLLSASMALAGITATGCRRWPVEELRPHTSCPVGSTPGVAEYYATLFELNGSATGILAKSYDGRPIKIEGNPQHPSSQGAANSLAQASVLDLYDPDRSRSLVYHQEGERKEATWEQFEAYAKNLFAVHRTKQGEGLAILLQPSSSPTQQRLVAELKQSLPRARWYSYQPLHHDHLWTASKSAFGRFVRCQYDLTQARTIVCIDSDLLGTHPASLKHARDWSAGRKAIDQGTMNELICLESSWSITGSVADTRLAVLPSQLEKCAEWLAARLGVVQQFPSGVDESLGKRLDAIAQKLMQSGKGAVLSAGPAASSRTHHLIHLVHEALGNVGSTIQYTEEPLADREPRGYMASIRELSELLQGNVIQSLVILGGNPVYDGPADALLDLTSTSQRPLVSIHLSTHVNETSQACTWHLPAAHALECWSDGTAWDGTYTLGQPLIVPLFGGKSTIEMLNVVAGSSGSDTRSMVRQTFERLFPDAGAKGWELALHDGLQHASQFKSISIRLAGLPQAPSLATNRVEAAGQDTFELQLVADSKMLDGRFANNAWLQELPDPISKLTWDNAVYISRFDAQQRGLTTGDVIEIRPADASATSLSIPVMVMPGQAVGCITVALGYGRTAAGRIGNQVGVNAFPFWNSSGEYLLKGCTIRKTSSTHKLASTQMHHVVSSIADVALNQRLGKKGQPGQLIHEASRAVFLKDFQAIHGASHTIHEAPLFDPPNDLSSPHRWGMAIDLNACIGCSGCVVACQAENNIPVVGKENVAKNREMHWLRIDRYFKGSVEDPDVVHVPTACVQCENAPCEQVCPVAATVHDAEGLNAMVYNRCIGTRYCSNNCPYKVRRFNYFDYQATDPREPAKPWIGIPDQQQTQDVSTLKKMVHNPDVSVRMRGVMEKCTYCVQRIVEARIRAKNEHAQGARASDLVQEGELQTACQATCPTQAIVFGDLNDPNSAVSKTRKNVRSYEMLGELNLGARTIYMAKIRNRDS